MTNGPIGSASTLARRLVEALRHEERQGRPGPAVSIAPNERPGSLEEAEAIQEEILRALGWPAAAWKLGATTVTARQALGLARFFSGLKPESRVLASPARLPRAALRQTGVECEIALRFGRDLPLRPSGYTPSEVRDALASAHPAFEIPQSRYAALGGEGPFALVADNGAGGWAVCGPGTDAIDLDGAFPVTLLIDGHVIQRGDVSALLQPLLQLVTDHVNRLARRGRATHAGEFILTGSLTPYQDIGAGRTAVADFGPLGRAELTFTD